MKNFPIEVCLKNSKKEIFMEIDRILLLKLLEIGADKYETEVLKAFTVLQRSSIVKKIKSLRYGNVDSEIIEVEDVENVDINREAVIKSAIDETDGIIVLSGEKAVDLFYTECCGGGTANSEDVLNYRINYLRKVLCRFCTSRIFEKCIKIGDYLDKSSEKYLNYKNEIQNVFKNIKRDDTGRIISIVFLNKTMTGEEFAEFFNMPGNRIYFAEESVRLKSIGEGIGLGICIEGASNMALLGMNYRDIINYYYTGITFEQIEDMEYKNALSHKNIIIDPGHGGEDTGYKSKNILEKDVNLSISNYIKEKLVIRGANVLLTREADLDIPLSDRADFINKIRPDFYISIHQNAFVSENVNGIEAYVYDKDNESANLASVILEKVNEKTGLKNRGVRSGDYFLTREAKVRGMIIECMYMSGSKDLQMLNDEVYKKISDAIYSGICIYYNISP